LHKFVKNTMSCDSRGHPRMAHKGTTMSVYFCSQCQSVESHVSFTPERKAEKSDGPEDMLSELYWNYKAFRRSTPFTTS
jgi:hypothetical protein